MSASIQAHSFLVQCLASDLRDAGSSYIRNAIRSDSLDWEYVVFHANRYQVVPLLWLILEKSGMTELLPADLRRYLSGFYLMNRQRNANLRVQLERVVDLLNELGVCPVLLKGAVHLVSRSYDDPGARIMTDLDILVPDKDLDPSVAALKSIGYREDSEFLSKNPGHHHWAPLFREGEYAAVEIHTRLLSDRSADVMREDNVRDHLEVANLPEKCACTLSLENHILHTFIHSEITDRGYACGRVPLRALHESAAMVMASSRGIDWSALERSLNTARARKIFRAYLYLLSTYLGIRVPVNLIRRPENWIHYLRLEANVRWDTVRKIDRRLQGYTEWEIRRRYLKGGVSRTIFGGRIKYTFKLLSAIWRPFSA